MGDRSRIVVVGGGISGLVAANRVYELDSSADVTLLEAGSRLGGVIRTEHRGGFLIEHGEENFITTMPWGVRLCERIGFDTELMPTNAQHRRAFVLHKGKLKPIPAGFAIMAPSRAWPVLSSSILSPMGKLRLAGELFARQRTSDDDESLASFVKRRLGRETYERLVQPLVSGIYTADPEKLSLQSTMPRFQEMERQHGSLICAMWKRKHARRNENQQASGARYSQFVAPRAGMSSLIDALAKRLPPNRIQLDAPVKEMRRSTSGEWQIQLGGSDGAALTADGVVLALPARRAADLLRATDVDLASDVASIKYGSCALVSFGFRRSQIQHPLDGFGVVIPIVERRKILSATFSSTKYSGRAPSDHVLIRTYIGGACQPELLDQDDDQLLAMAHEELSDLLDIQGQPVLSHINRQQNAMPQYHVGHLSLVKRIASRVNNLEGLVLAGNSLQGVGVPQCVHSAEVAVESLLENITSRTRSASTSPTT